MFKLRLGESAVLRLNERNTMQCPKPKKKKARGLSDSHLLNLHRKAVRALFGYKCFFCGGTNELEVHHLVKRKNFLLRYNWRNGVLVCKYICHAHAETPEGKHQIDLLIEPHRKYLQDRSGQSKDWFVKHGMSRHDYCIEMKLELEKILLANE